MIEIKVDCNTYTEEEFQRDLKRYFDTLDKDCSPCKLYEDCERCMFFKHALCGKSYVKAKPIENSFEIIEKVYEWAQRNPIITNIDKLKEIFGEEKAKEIISRIMFYANNEDFGEWLSEEYKEPDQ